MMIKHFEEYLTELMWMLLGASFALAAIDAYGAINSSVRFAVLALTFGLCWLFFRFGLALINRVFTDDGWLGPRGRRLFTDRWQGRARTEKMK